MATRRAPWAQTVANWREYEAPLTTKLRLAIRNNWKKIRTRRSCCGNRGEPGC